MNFRDFDIDYSNFNNGDRLHILVHDVSTDIYYVKDLVIGLELVRNFIGNHPINMGGFYINATTNGSCFIEATTTAHLKYNSINSNGASVVNSAKVAVWRYKAIV